MVRRLAAAWRAATSDTAIPRADLRGTPGHRVTRHRRHPQDRHEDDPADPEMATNRHDGTED